MTRLLAAIILLVGLAPAMADQAVTRWVGKYPYDVMEDPGERARFRQIMDARTLKTFRKAVNVASPIGSDGIHILGEGCWPHNCGERAGFFAIEIATGRTFAVMLFDGQRYNYGGRTPAALEKIVREYIRRTGF